MTDEQKPQIVSLEDALQRRKRMDRYAGTFMDISLDLHLLAATIDLVAYVANEEAEPTTISDYGPTFPLVLNDV
jgi:hypothetical protein